jgi:G protein-coupled receptor 139
MSDNATAFQFTEQLNDISMYILPILALVGNSITLLVILTNPQFNRSSFSVYVKAMAISDTFVLIFKLLSYQNKTSKYFYFSSLCTILIFCSEASVLLSIWIIVSITIERTLVVLFPLHKKKFVSVYRARSIVIIIGILTIIFSTRVLIIPIDKSIEHIRRCHPMPGWQSYRRINKTITEFGYCHIPLTIVIIGNLLTICTVKRAVVQRHDMFRNSTYEQKRQMNSNEKQLMLMLLIVTLMFIVYFVPFTIVEIIQRWGLPFGICFTQKSFEIYMIIRSLSELLKDLNFCTNFIIYCVSGRRFRYALISLFKRLHRRSSLTSINFDSNRNRSDYLLKRYCEPRTNYLSARNTIEESQF